MRNQQLLFSLLIAGMSLGTAWAIRGQFGHEQGAAWAGGIGALSIVLLAKRKNWYQKAFQLSLASAAGWGVAGIVSYGLVVGYGRGTDFGNVYYGLLMLFVIGSLFGLLGGGLFGLMLGNTTKNPVDWPRLLTEMCAGAIIFYYFFVEQLGWLMTPPRSEAWAACFGMTVALFWHMLREKRYSALRVAIFAGLGGGFGFAFGNFLQVMGSVSGYKFNFWNVMEYSIGFFGGIGMAYGTFTSEWEKSEDHFKPQKLLAPIMILALVIPLIVWDQSFESERLLKTIQEIRPDLDAFAWTSYVKIVALLVVLLFAGFNLYKYYSVYKKNGTPPAFNDLKVFFLGNLSLYTIYSLLITCAFMSLYRVEQYLYILNLLAIGLSIRKPQPHFTAKGIHLSRWTISFLLLLAVIALFTFVAIHSHGQLKGSHNRFE